MLRQIINIDKSKCNGCGKCAQACHEGAIGIINGKATLLRDDYCDGMGDCLPECPTGAISFEYRDTLAYNEAAVEENKLKRSLRQNPIPELTLPNIPLNGACPGSQIKQMSGQSSVNKTDTGLLKSELCNWPVQIKLAPVKAPYFENADLLIAADCTAYAYADFHKDFIRGKTTLIGCPKLDSVDYSEKLTEIIRDNNIKSVSIVRMQVPCCGGIEAAAKKAIALSGKHIPWQVVTISIDGKII